MQIKRRRWGRAWTYWLQGMDIEEALANADRDIEELREKVKEESLEVFRELSKNVGS